MNWWKGTYATSKEADVLYVVFQEDTVARTTHLDDLRLVDYSADGGVLGIEFIDASSGIDLRDIPFAKTTERLIGDTGLNIPILAS
ncbi:MAG: DUF2283 domain-containing protein [Dehalococcoidia bacterium]|nr:DUF2283 domain-containing protein [Dehalococcoidia bacterium]